MSPRLSLLQAPYANLVDFDMASNSSGDLGSSVKTESERIDNVSRQNQDADRGREHTGPLSDDERLRMLGYDAVLGRPFGFWSSAAMNVCHNSFIFEFIAYTSLYAWNGPLLFVRTVYCTASITP